MRTKNHDHALPPFDRDVKPVAPTHVLIVPKRRDGLTQLRYATADQAGVLGHMLEVAARIATQEELEGFRYGFSVRRCLRTVLKSGEV